jgi:hypothetical protein
MVAFPATTWPPVGNANFGKTGIIGLANALAETSSAAVKKACEILPANLTLAKQFFNDVFRERSDLS